MTSQETPATLDPSAVKVTQEFAYESPLIGCRFSPAGDWVAASAQDNAVVLWHLESDAKKVLRSHDSWVRGFEFTADGQQLVTSGFDGRMIWWDLSSDEPSIIRRLDSHSGWIRASDQSPDAKWIATASNDLAVKLWDFESGSELRQFDGHEKHVYSVLFHPTEPVLLSGDLGGTVHQWQRDTGEKMRSFDAKVLHSYNGGQRVDFGGIRSLAISPDQKTLACGGLHNASNPLGAVHEPLIVLFDWESSEAKNLIAPDIKGVVWRCLYHPSGLLIAGCGGSSGGYLIFWNGSSDKDCHRLKLPHLARDMDLHRDQNRIATAHYDRKLRISALQPAA